MSAVGLIVVQWVSAGLGGYITGRLRTKWVSVHTHEVFFRDTAHGLIMWALATVFVTSVAIGLGGSAIGAGLRGATAMGSAALGAMAGANNNAIDAYDADVLLRPATPNASAPTNDLHAQTMRILANGFVTGDVSADDQTYLAQIVSAQAGISQADAQARVNAAVAKVKAAKLKAQQEADAARVAAEEASIYTALSLLVGAFIACIGAALGGRLRDLHSYAGATSAASLETPVLR
jgi:hypothetical protein